jgi:glycosyltransferase involved in cell wall biosynthesis
VAPVAADGHEVTASPQLETRPAYHPEVRCLSNSRLPRLSVIIPCFNYGRFLTDCVDSVLQQPAVDLEVVIINDASSDNTAEIAHGFANRDPRVSVIDHVKNRGLFPSVNEGLERVSGDYVVKLDADDMLTPGSLARSTALLEAHPRVGFVYGRALYFGADLKRMRSLSHRWLRRSTLLPSDHPTSERIDTRVRGWTVWPGETWLALRCARGVCPISQPEVVIRTSAVREVGGYDIGLPVTSDFGLWLRLAARNDVAYIAGAIQGLYRVHTGSMQRIVYVDKLKELRARRATFDSSLAHQPKSIPNADQLLRTAQRALAAESLENACRAFDRGRALAEPVDDYVAFAFESYPDAASLPEWRRLSWRRRVGARLSHYCPLFQLRAVVRRATEEIQAARWWRTGV